MRLVQSPYFILILLGFCVQRWSDGALSTNLLGLRHTSLRLRGGAVGEDPLVSAHERGDTKSEAGMRILSKRLRRASERGLVKEMLAALSDGADPQGVDLAGFTSLHLAAERGQIDAVSLLLERGADPNARDGLVGRTPLHSAAATGSHKVIAQLVEGGANVEARDDAGRTPLAVAAWEGKTHVITELLQLCADPSAPDIYGMGPDGLAEATPSLDELDRGQVVGLLRKAQAEYKKPLALAAAAATSDLNDII